MTDRQDIRQALDHLARQEVPESLDLWDAIKAQIEAEDAAERRSGRALWLMRTSQVAAAALLAAIVGLGTLTAIWMIGSRMASNGNSVSGPVSVASLYTDLNMTQVRDDVTFNVSRAFADTNRAVIDYGYVINSNVTYRAIPRLSTADGVALPATFGMGNNTLTDTQAEARYTFDMSGLNTLASSVDFVFEVELEPLSPEDAAINDGGGGAMPVQGGSAWSQRSDGRLTFVFTFSLRVIPELVMEEIPAQTVAGINIRLERVRVSPSQTQFDLCMTLPNTTNDWVPVLTITGDTFSRTTVLYEQIEIADGVDCRRGTYMLPYVPGQSDEWAVTVHFLRSSFADTTENAVQLQSTLTEQGIEAAIESQDTGEPALTLHGVLETTPRSPADFDLTVETALAALGQRVDGPWVFTIPVE